MTITMMLTMKKKNDVVFAGNKASEHTYLTN